MPQNGAGTESAISADFGSRFFFRSSKISQEAIKNSAVPARLIKLQYYLTYSAAFILLLVLFTIFFNGNAILITGIA